MIFYKGDRGHFLYFTLTLSGAQQKWAPDPVGVPIFFTAPPPFETVPLNLRVDAVFERLARLERYGVARLDFHWLTGLRVFAGAGAAVALQESAEADQGDAVFAVQGAGDFFEDGVEDAVGLFFGEIGFFSDGGCEFWFTHM
ncbi:hypothetical protein METHPM2_210050 [Pseudomonas sp. PM2]